MVLSNLKETLEDIDNKISEWNNDIALGKALEKQKADPNFQLVILDGYIESESKRLFDALLDQHLETDTTKVLASIEAIVSLKRYITNIESRAENAPYFIAKEEEFRKEATAIAEEEV